MSYPLRKRAAAECLGTFWLVFGGCGSAITAAAFPSLGIGFLGVALAFGLTVLTMAYAIGPISGCHVNPAVTIGLTAARRFPLTDAGTYIVAQLVGAVAGAIVLYIIASGRAGFSLADGFAANGYGAHSPGGYSLFSCLVAEIVLTFMFLMVIIATTGPGASPGFAPLAIGLALTLVHLVDIPITNASVNPARSTSQAVFVGGWALSQLWLFWVAPIFGGWCAGKVYDAIFGSERGGKWGEERAPRAA